MKIAVPLPWFDPESGPAALCGEDAREFVKQGDEVNTFTSFFYYSQDELHAGYKMMPRTLGVHGEWRFALYPNHSSPASGRLPIDGLNRRAGIKSFAETQQGRSGSADSGGNLNIIAGGKDGR